MNIKTSKKKFTGIKIFKTILFLLFHTQVIQQAYYADQYTLYLFRCMQLYAVTVANYNIMSY